MTLAGKPLCALVLAMLPLALAVAQPYPSKPIRLIVGSSAGGGGDIMARTVSPPLSDTLGQQVIIDNRPGAGGNIGADIVAKAPPDGYTLLFAFTGHVINPGLYSKLPFDTVRDFAPITILATNQTLLLVHPSVPVKSVKDLIALAKSRPGKLTVAGLPGGSQHLAGELFKAMAGIDLLFVPFKGNGPALSALLGGEVDISFNTVAAAQSFVRAGKLRALAVAGSRRSELVPDLPTISEAGLPGFSSSGWYGILAPAGTPQGTITRLNQALVTILRSTEMKQRLMSSGNEPVGNAPEEFDAFIRKEIPRWEKVIKGAGIKLQ